MPGRPGNISRPGAWPRALIPQASESCPHGPLKARSGKWIFYYFNYIKLKLLIIEFSISGLTGLGRKDVFMYFIMNQSNPFNTPNRKLNIFHLGEYYPLWTVEPRDGNLCLTLGVSTLSDRNGKGEGDGDIDKKNLRNQGRVGDGNTSVPAPSRCHP